MLRALGPIEKLTSDSITVAGNRYEIDAGTQIITVASQTAHPNFDIEFDDIVSNSSRWTYTEAAVVTSVNSLNTRNADIVVLTSVPYVYGASPVYIMGYSASAGSDNLFKLDEVLIDSSQSLNAVAIDEGELYEVIGQKYDDRKIAYANRVSKIHRPNAKGELEKDLVDTVSANPNGIHGSGLRGIHGSGLRNAGRSSDQ